MVNKSSHERLVRLMNRRSKKCFPDSHRPSLPNKKMMKQKKKIITFTENADVISLSSSGSDSESESESEKVRGSMKLHCGTTESSASHDKTQNPDGSSSDLPSDEDDDIIVIVSENEVEDQLQNTDQVQVEVEERVSDPSSSHSFSDDESEIDDEDVEADESGSEPKPKSRGKEPSLVIDNENNIMETLIEEKEDSDVVISHSHDIVSDDEDEEEEEEDEEEEKDEDYEDEDDEDEDYEDEEEGKEDDEDEEEEYSDYGRKLDEMGAEMNNRIISSPKGNTSLESNRGNENDRTHANEVHNGEKVVNGNATDSKGLKRPNKAYVEKKLRVKKDDDVILQKDQTHEFDGAEEEVEDNSKQMAALWAEMHLGSSQIHNTSSPDCKQGNENKETDANEVCSGERVVNGNARDSKDLKKPNKVDVEKKLRVKKNDNGFLKEDQTHEVDGAEEETADDGGEMDALWAEKAEVNRQICNTSLFDSKRENENGEKNTNEGHNGKRGRDSDQRGSEGMKKPKKVDVFKLLVNSIWEEHQTREGAVEDEVVVAEEIVDEVPEMSDSDRGMADLWAEMDRSLVTSQIGNISALGSNVQSGHDEKQSTLCKHDFVLDEEIGVRCLHCSFVDVEIRDFIPPMDKFAAEPRGRKDSYEDINVFGGAKFRSSTSNPQETSDHAQGTVWDLVPGAWKNMFAHQRDGFEFIWKNLAGTIKLDELKDNCNSNEVVGCLISHGPGTGKTKLSLTFLKSFLEKFESCKPVIVAPASMLLPWEGEFRKWNIGVPFHNLNSLDFSGKESQLALSMMEMSGHQGQDKNLIRMMKIHSWRMQKSVLGISYSLYEKLLGVGFMSGKGTANRKKAARSQEWEDMRKILLEVPSLLILDEGHTPRNKRSQIWQVLSKAHAKKRIILSGTPFQNNFEELHNVICLVRPKLARKIPSGLIKSSSRKRSRSKKVVDDADGIEKLKNLISPFVHHKGGILEKNLPGLRKCVVVLNPSDLQKELLLKVRSTQNNFEFEHRESLVAIHPSLLLESGLYEEEESSIDKDNLRSLEENPNEGAKTRFLVEFIRLCSAMNEKVLIFSQYIHPLSFMVKQLSKLFGWSEGRQVLLMHGKLQQKQRQVLINSFNDPAHESRVLIASTRACSEGINLVGASRVVLLDVVWNPSVVRQAISRAYRLGQKRVVYSYHLITRGATEWDKYCKQDEKDRIAEMVFTSASTNRECESGDGHKGRAVWEDDVLDDMVRHEKLKGLFEKVIYQHNESNLVESLDP